MLVWGTFMILLIRNPKSKVNIRNQFLQINPKQFFRSQTIQIHLILPQPLVIVYQKIQMLVLLFLICKEE